MRPLADGLMRAANWLAPERRRAWVEAMAAEYAVLSHGHLAWALGGLATTLRWRAEDGAPIVAAVVLVAILLEALEFPLMFLAWLFDKGIAFHAIFYTLTYGPLALACMLLARLNRRAWVFVGTGVPIMSFVIGDLTFCSYFKFSPFDFWKINIMDARWDVGLGALVGYGLLGALIGRAWAGGSARPRPHGTDLPIHAPASGSDV